MGCSKQNFIGDEVAGNDKASGMTTRVMTQWGRAKRVRSERVRATERPGVSDGLFRWIAMPSRIVTGTDEDKGSKPGMKTSRESADVPGKVTAPALRWVLGGTV